jgi:hypothetical protein
MGRPVYIGLTVGLRVARHTQLTSSSLSLSLFFGLKKEKKKKRENGRMGNWGNGGMI